MQNIYIKTADQDTINADTPLRFFIYKKYTEPGTYQLRGSVKDLGVSESTYDNTNFAGFYYDIDKNLGKEQLTFKLTGDDPASKTLSDQEPRGITYTTTAQPKNFKFKPWGQYEVIGFLAERYFAAYDNAVTAGMTDAGETVAYIYDKSKNRNLMTNEQIAKVLMDDNKEITITNNNPLTLADGYKLAIKNVDVKGNKAYVELSKNDQVVDSKVVQPSIDNAKMTDKTYYYKVDLGDTKEIVQIAVHFKNAFAGSDTNIATVDGVFQVSDAVTPLKSEQQYDKMSIRKVEPTTLTITMDNKDNQVTLSKNKDVVLMQNVHIKTADQDTINADTPLRYFIYKSATIEAANVTAPAAAPAAAAPAEAANVTTEAKPAAENVTAPAAATPAAEAAKPANATAEKPANATAPAAAKQPGFEGIFAITGLLAVAYLVLGRKQ
jgi:S-layer protein (TIGR01567 family)